MIEKMVLFENQKQLEETRDELERCKRFSFRSVSYTHLTLPTKLEV